MLTHFQLQSLYENKQMPGWRISFYYKREKYTAIYHQNGSIEWTSSIPPEINKKNEQIHELMLFHVYDK
ncbi:YheE family protein [Bacillus aquiflavi]|uniref:YheE family protein n=1 Tax=Bacillus aquiflavi TaxID=2672567 RepID=UPI001CAA3F9E|nr:YheE family protein [Bacillus aquiflavi]UAC48954.1 YheE family protein [Bacillus aquiflavi]